MVDDATHEAIALPVERSMGGEHLTRVLDAVHSLRGQPQVVRSDNGPELTGTAMVMWTHRQGIELRLIGPGTPNQNAYVENLEGGLRAECVNEH